MSHSKVRLVPIIHKVLSKRFERSGRFIFGWKWSLPIFFVTKKQLSNFAHDIADHAVYETSNAYEGAP